MTVYKSTFTALALVIATSACVFQKLPGSANDEVGEDPPDAANMTGWLPAHTRYEAFTENVPYPGYESPPSELEYAPFAPSVFDHDPAVDDWASLPHKPWVPGLSNALISLVNPNGENGPFAASGEQNPYYYEYPPGSYGPDFDGPVPTFEEGNLRSGLIGNFALWVQGVVPSVHPRPPIVYRNLLLSIGDPVGAGRYNAYGPPCSTVYNHTQGEFCLNNEETDWEDDVEPNHADCAHGALYYGVEPIGLLYPLRTDWGEPVGDYHGSESIPAMEAGSWSRCLDNGERYKIFDPEFEFDTEAFGAIDSADQRNGLVWANWDEFDSIAEWILANTGPLGDLAVLLDWLADDAYTYWPIDPEWSWARWSNTGVCAYSSRLSCMTIENGDRSWSTSIGCPLGFQPIMPSFDSTACGPINAPPVHVQGYCTLPTWGAPPASAFVPTDDLPVAPVDPDLGIPGGFVIGLRSTADVERLRLGLRAITATPSSEGLVVRGGQLLEALAIAPGSMIATAGHGDSSINGRDVTVDSLTSYVLGELDGNGLPRTLMFEIVTGSVHRFVYLFPDIGLLSPAPG